MYNNRNYLNDALTKNVLLKIVYNTISVSHTGVANNLYNGTSI